MKSLRRTCLAILAGAMTFSTAAYAGAESGPYIGAGIGQSSIELKGYNRAVSGDDSAYKLVLGYNFGLLPLLDLGIEGAYVDFGKINGGGVEYKQTAWNGFGLVGLSLGPIGLFGKLGLAAWDADTTIASVTTTTSGTDSAYGIGARLQLGPISGRLEYEAFDIEGTKDNSMTSVSLLYTFF
jgi:hypothetical protein